MTERREAGIEVLARLSKKWYGIRHLPKEDRVRIMQNKENEVKLAT